MDNKKYKVFIKLPQDNPNSTHFYCKTVDSKEEFITELETRPFITFYDEWQNLHEVVVVTKHIQAFYFKVNDSPNGL